MAWGRELYRLAAFHVVRALVPAALADRFYRGTMDGRPAVAVYPELLAELNLSTEISLVTGAGTEET
jgi:hypothetical protein